MIGIFFVHDINPGIGGVESHQKAFVEYFFCKSFFNFIIEKNKGLTRKTLCLPKDH